MAFFFFNNHRCISAFAQSEHAHKLPPHASLLNCPFGEHNKASERMALLFKIPCQLILPPFVGGDSSRPAVQWAWRSLPIHATLTKSRHGKLCSNHRTLSLSLPRQVELVVHAGLSPNQTKSPCCEQKSTGHSHLNKKVNQSSIEFFLTSRLLNKNRLINKQLTNNLIEQV